jgi:hypothetical protein
MASLAEPNSLSRRTFLRQSILGSLFLSCGGLVRPLLGQSAQSLLYFSDHEFEIMKSVAAQIIGLEASSPLSPREVALRADQFLSEEPPEIQDQVHTLLYAFNAPIFAFLFDFRFSSFLNMSEEDQQSYLEDWMTSNFAFRRTGFQALKKVSLSMYYTDSRSWPGIQYDGMFLPWER